MQTFSCQRKLLHTHVLLIFACVRMDWEGSFCNNKWPKNLTTSLDSKIRDNCMVTKRLLTKATRRTNP